MDAITKAEVLIIGAIFIAVIAFAGYEVVEHREELEELKDTGIVQSGLGLVLIKEVGKGIEHIGKGLEEDYDTLRDIGHGDLEKAREDYIIVEYGNDTLQWFNLFGGDVYNTGLINLNVEYLRENAAILAKRHGPLRKYLEKVGDDKMIRRGLNDQWRLSPFQTRQNLTSLPFSNELHGALGSSVSTLKSEIWTDWDRLPEYVSNWKSLSTNKKESIAKMMKEDIARLSAMEKTGDYRAAIVEDRVRSWNEIFLRNKIQL